MQRAFTASLRFMAATLCIVCLRAPAAQAQLFGVSERDELAAGRQADAQIRQQYHISNDRDYNGLVNQLGKRLARVCDRPNIPFIFRVIDSQEINAFSVPGFVYVNTGLLQAVGDDQDALACVIGHEIGHTCGRHAVKEAQRSQIENLIAGLIGGRDRTAQVLTNLGANLIQLGHSRGDEYDADRRGIKYAIKAGYDPNGLIRFFDMLRQKMGDSSGVATYFQTHPATGDRIKRAEDEIRKDEALYGNG